MYESDELHHLGAIKVYEVDEEGILQYYIIVEIWK